MFKDTDRIRQAAITFIELGHYTTSLPGTKDYYDFWDEEKKRCLYGYKIGNLHVTGFHYFYLNYCPIDRAVDEQLPDGSIQSKRERTFPRFYDGDWEYFQEIDVLLVVNFVVPLIKLLGDLDKKSWSIKLFQKLKLLLTLCYLRTFKNSGL